MARHHVASSTIDELVRELNRITQLSSDLIAEARSVEESLAADWSGSGNSQYSALQAEWSAGAATMQAAAQHITDRARTAAANYETAADHSKSVWG